MRRVERSTVRVNGSSLDWAASSSLKFVKTGCTPLNLVLGGGWPLGRIANIVGDESTGKTLLAIEAISNFARDYPKGLIWYRESEAAFDDSYAEALGMPVDRVRFLPKTKAFDTVEDFYDDLKLQVAKCESTGKPGLYVLDSLDALSDRAELKQDIDTPSYGTGKSRLMSQLFRRVVRLVESSQLCLIVISQTRAKIGISFGRKVTRSGGRALGFYASQVLYLSHIKTNYRKRKGQKRATGILIKAKTGKNKVGLPFRECVFPIRFMYGIEDLQACVGYLKESKELRNAKIDRDLAADILANVDLLSPDEYKEALEKAQRGVISIWRQTEQSFLPKHRKYT